MTGHTLSLDPDKDFTSCEDRLIVEEKSLSFPIIGETRVFAPVDIVFSREIFADKTSTTFLPRYASGQHCLNCKSSCH